MTLIPSLMATDKLAARMKATESLMRLYAAAEECTRLYRRAGLPVPREVALLTTWGDDEARREEQAEKRQLLTIPPPMLVMERGWLSIDLASALPITVVPALLRDNPDPLPVKDVRDRLLGLGIAATEGSIDNIGTKLDHAKIIRRTMAGWQLIEPSQAAVLSAGRLHGPKNVFQLQEIAAHRREAELEYLREYGTLSRSQLIDLLQQSEWVVAPVNVFLVKADLLALQSQKQIRRVKSDNPRNFDWELVKKKGQLRLANLNSAS